MPSELTYRVELWDSDHQRTERVLAVAADPSVAMAAFAQAVRDFPTRHVIVRQNDRIFAQHQPKAQFDDQGPGG